MPELPYLTLTSPGSTQTTTAAAETLSPRHGQRGNLPTNSSCIIKFGKELHLARPGMLSPRQSPVMASIENSPSFPVALVSATEFSKGGGGGGDDDFASEGDGGLYGSSLDMLGRVEPNVVRSVTHRVQSIAKLEDIVESARAFSDLTNPKVIRQLCCTTLEGWFERSVREDEVQVSQIMAGLTNQLFMVFLADSVDERVLPRRVLFRVYGKTVGDLYDPSFELTVFKTLSKIDSAPALLAEFPGGRIEEYILGPALLMKDMVNPAVLCAVATILAKFHKLHETVPEIHSWKSDEASLWTSLNRWSAKAWSLYELARSTAQDTDGSQQTTTQRQRSAESVVSTEELLLDRARFMSTADKNRVVKDLESTLIVEMIEEVSLLKDVVIPPIEAEKASPILQVAFCHNDVQENNILVTGPRLRLIDFEYANYNYPAFDIANFFCEMTIDYCVEEYPFYTHQLEPEKFPSGEVIRLFGSVYLSQYHNQPILPSNTEVLDSFVNIVMRFVLTSHLLWGFWSVIRAPQAETSSDFDFLAYARSRFEAYKAWKAHLISMKLVGAERKN